MNTEQKIAQLEATVEKLANQVGLLEDANAIRRLQYTYGYLIDKCMYAETVDLFADDGEVRFMGGIYKGKEGVRRLYIGRRGAPLHRALPEKLHRRQQRPDVRLPAGPSADADDHRRGARRQNCETPRPQHDAGRTPREHH